MIIIEKSTDGVNYTPYLVAGIAFIGVVVSAIISYIAANKAIKANVVSKARIEWIQNVRNEAARLISLVFKYLDYSTKNGVDVETINEGTEYIDSNGEKKISSVTFKCALKKIKPRYETDDSNVESLKFEVFESINRLRLFFGPDQSGNNKLFLNKLDYLEQQIVQDNAELRAKTEIKALVEELRIYLKIEWLRASGVIQDKEVDKKYKELRDSMLKYLEEIYSKEYKQ